MHFSYLFLSVLASSKAIADPTGAAGLNISATSHSARPYATVPPSPIPNVTLADGTVIQVPFGGCWAPPDPPIPSTTNSSSHNISDGLCSACVSQSLPDPMNLTTTGTLAHYGLHLRDGAKRNLGVTVRNKTLAAFGGQTANHDTNITVHVDAGKPFQLWTMRDPVFPTYAAVYMDYAGPGPADPLTMPWMVYEYDEVPGTGTVGRMSCTTSAVSLGNTTVYFQCDFEC